MAIHDSFRSYQALLQARWAQDLLSYATFLMLLNAVHMWNLDTASIH